MKRIIPVLFLAFAIPACQTPESCDLAITRARLFDVHTGTVRGVSTILVRDGRIAGIVADGGKPAFSAADTLDAAGRLVTPGLIDVHCHSGTILADSLSMAPDSLRRYRDRLSRAYLPFGVTTVRSCGDSERWLPMLEDWMIRRPDAPDFHPCGAAIVSPDDRRFAGHVQVTGSDGARAKVREYHDAGFRHLKVYWRLREPEFEAVMDEAKALGMNVTGHVDYRLLGIERAMELGLRHFEHAYTLGVDTIDSTGYAYINGGLFVDHYGSYIAESSVPGSFFISRIELFNRLGAANPAMRQLIGSLKSHGAGVTPTLHIFAQRFGLSWFTTPSTRPGYDDTEVLTGLALERCRAGYRILAGYVNELHAAGIPLTIGSDWADPGKACLSEMMLLNEAGIPMTDVLVAATWNGALEMGIESEVGSIEVGRKANFVIFDQDPMIQPENLLRGMLVLKDGVVIGRGAARP